MDALLLSAKDAARLLGISERLYYSLHSSGRLGPLPVRLNKRTLWSRKELDAWVDAGCLPREQWQEMKKAVGASRN